MKIPTANKQNKPLTVLFIFIIIIVLIAFKFRSSNKAINITKSIENPLVITNKTDVSIINNMKIDAKIIENELVDKGHRKKDIKGTIMINNKKYRLKGSNWGEATNNLYWGELIENDDSDTYKYIFFLSDDFSSIYLDNTNGSEKIVAPAKTIEEAAILKDKLLGDN